MFTAFPNQSPLITMEKAGFLGPISSKMTVTKEKERRKRGSEEKERRRREKKKAMASLLVL